VFPFFVSSNHWNFMPFIQYIWAASICAYCDAGAKYFRPFTNFDKVNVAIDIISHGNSNVVHNLHEWTHVYHGYIINDASQQIPIHTRSFYVSCNPKFLNTSIDGFGNLVLDIMLHNLENVKPRGCHGMKLKHIITIRKPICAPKQFQLVST